MEVWAAVRSAAEALLADDILLATSILKVFKPLMNFNVQSLNVVDGR